MDVGASEVTPRGRAGCPLARLPSAKFGPRRAPWVRLIDKPTAGFDIHRCGRILTVHCAMKPADADNSTADGFYLVSGSARERCARW
jgi:hypothetical protein